MVFFNELICVLVIRKFIEWKNLLIRSKQKQEVCQEGLLK